MAKYKFEVHYDGPALENNTMPIKDLAPSLLSLSEVFQTIQKIKNPEEAPLSLNINATNKGSFIAELLLVNGSDLLQKAMDMINSSPSEALINLTTYVGIFVEVVNVIKKIANKKIKDKKEKDGKVELKLDDNTKLTMSEDAFRAYKSVEFRQEIHDVVKPIDSDRITSINFFHNKAVKISVTEKEYQKSDVPAVQEKQLNSEISEVYLQIINVAFEHGKWKFSNGSSQYIVDEDFLQAVKKNEQRFGSTDTLKVKLQTVQSLDTNGKLKSAYTVLKVLDYIKDSEQIELDLFDHDDED